jgi:hypothetical protein
MAGETPQSFIKASTWAGGMLAFVALGFACWRALDVGEPAWKVAGLVIVGLVAIPAGSYVGYRTSVRRAGRRGHL